MVEIREEWKSILNALIAAPVAWQSPTEIAAALGRGIEETTDVLSVMDEADWLSVWDVEPGPLITLSALAAHRLEVVLVEVGPEETPRWLAANQPTPPSPKASNVAASEHYARQDKMLDPELSPEDAAENFERRLAYHGREINLPLPTLLLGQNLTPWPGPGEFTAAEICPRVRRRPASSLRLLPRLRSLGAGRGAREALADVSAGTPDGVAVIALLNPE